MPTRSAEAKWSGDLLSGTGTIKFASGAYEGAYDWRGRSGDGAGTNPEELIAAAHAGCFSMALSHGLAQNGTPAKHIHTTAKVTLEQDASGFTITGIALTLEAEVPGLDEAGFLAQAAGAKSGCPVSKALAATPITLSAKLIS